MTSGRLNIGIDVGSTTTKLIALDAQNGEVVFQKYIRHHAHQAQSAANLLRELAARYPDAAVRAVITGSGGAALAEALGIPYMQEVVANAFATQRLYPHARTAIELGGQDAKMIFFAHDETTGGLSVRDMRMNGTCAGGTGAFIDEIANLLDIPIEDFNAAALEGETVYSISGRCGVFAKTDIQPLLNQGVPKGDLALSSFHAIAKQTIGGLAQGIDIHPPVIFEGGPLTFNPRLIEVFAERLELKPDEVIIPNHPETIVARGAALSIGETTDAADARIDIAESIARLESPSLHGVSLSQVEPFFSSAAECATFRVRHALPPQEGVMPEPGTAVRAFLGIDCGSTTTKLALIDEEENLLWSFYASNDGEPIDITCRALIAMREEFAARGNQLEIAGLGTTGYGEALIAEALCADCHMVETVAHARATTKAVPNASFILDIGGQDMKAIWLRDGIINNIVVNEACSSGCGSFLEGFAANLGIAVEDIADAAFRSSSPADLGSRCTVFMNSSIVTEQRNGKKPDDIMAGLCRSIILNVFTKVIRMSNLSSLGSGIVAQGGTFRNDAVLRAFEQYLGRPVTRAPYPGLMGALGAALIAKEQMTRASARSRVEERGVEVPAQSSFIGLDALDTLTYTQEANLECPFCNNHCNRLLVRFSTGAVYVMGNRCERGSVVDEQAQTEALEVQASQERLPDLFAERSRLVFQDWPLEFKAPRRSEVIGLPRVLFYWDNMPFWKTFFQALGFKVKLSRLASRKQFESGLQAVPSDTICFPAKLVHGAIRDLCKQGVDYIFMPSVTTVPSENASDTSISMCAVVKGYGMVMRNSDNPERLWEGRFENPLMHWFTEADRERQLIDYMKDTFGISARHVRRAIAAADDAMCEFHAQMETRGADIIEQIRERGGFGVVLAGRPYHGDRLVNHDLPKLFAAQNVIAIPVDFVPHIGEIDLSKSRIDVVNNFHARMLEAAVYVASCPYLEFAQIVSFGCGHDAYLTDEIIRLMGEVNRRTPLVLKVDESDATGPLNIRVRSFIETARMRRGLVIDASERRYLPPSGEEVGRAAQRAALLLDDPYPQKFEESDRELRTVLVPNTSHAFCLLMSAVFEKTGLKVEPLPIGRDRAIYLGKKYVHNDICFPAQIVIGEALEALESGKYDLATTAVGTGKYIGDCRLTHYEALLRKALDDAGYAQVPIITNDDVDAHNVHPGFRMDLASAVRVAYALPMIDCMEDLLRKMRPYELVPGAANAAFDAGIACIMDGLRSHGVSGAKRGFKRAIDIMKRVEYDRSNPRPRVLIVGEYLLNFHPGANHDIEDYLERNGMEIIEAKMTDVIRKTYFYQRSQIEDYKVDRPLDVKMTNIVSDSVFEKAHDLTDKIAAAHPLYTPPTRMPELVKGSDTVFHHSFDAGEGVLIPAEIIHHAQHGCRNFVILQPFGCLPNHVVGRGIAKRLKEMFPDAQILPLDYDPDSSFANIENRLQMLIMNAR